MTKTSTKKLITTGTGTGAVAGGAGAEAKAPTGHTGSWMIPIVVLGGPKCWEAQAAWLRDWMGD